MHPLSSFVAFAPEASNAYTIGVLLGSFLAAYFVIALICYIIYIIANWKIFTKAGEKGWKVLIPFYSEYIRYKITWKTSMFWIVLALLVVGFFFYTLFVPSSILYFVGCIILLAGFIIETISLYFLSKSFGHGAGYFIGLLLLPFIFTLIIAFGKSSYQGPAGE